MANGDRAIYEQFNGNMVKVNEPTCHPEQANFVITFKERDWSGFRTLAECEKQFSQLQCRTGDFFAVVQR